MSPEKLSQVAKAAAAALAAYFSLSLGSGIQALEADIYAEKFPSSTGMDPATVVLADIEEESLSRLGPWPLAKGAFVRAAENAYSAGAAVVAFDVIFAEPPAAEDLSLLPNLARKYTSTVFAVGERPDNHLYRELAEMKPLRGHVAARADGAGQAVAIPRLSEAGSFPEVIARAYCRVMSISCQSPREGPAVPSYSSTSPAWGIDFEHRPAVFRRLKFIDLLENRGLQGKLAGRIVVISPSAQALGDMKTLPIENRHPRRQHPGALVMAYAVETLLKGRETWMLAPWVLVSGLLVTNMTTLRARQKLGKYRNDAFWLLALLWLIASWIAFKIDHLYVPATICILNSVYLWLSSFIPDAAVARRSVRK